MRGQENKIEKTFTYFLDGIKGEKVRNTLT